MLTIEQNENLLQLLKRARSAESFEKPYWFILDLALGNTNNVYVDGQSQSLQSSSLVDFSTSMGYQFLKNEKISYSLGYTLNYEYPVEVGVLKFFNHILTTTARFVEQNFSAGVSPSIQVQNWNNIDSIQKNGVSLNMAYQVFTAEFGVDLSFYNKTALDSVYSYVEGSEYLLRPHYDFWSQNLYTQLAIFVGSDLSRDIQYSDGAVLPLNQAYVGVNVKNVWSYDEKNFLQTSFSFNRRNFKNHSQPVDKERVDQELALNLKYSHYILPKLFIYATIDHVGNQSTLGAGDVRDKNYKTSVLSLGINWDVFE